MKYIDEEFKLIITENDNIKPNTSLVAPSLYPPYIGNNDGGYPVFVKIPLYPYISVGDSITVDIEGLSSPSYTITQEDIDGEILIYIDRSNIPKDKILSGQNIKISYTVDDNDNYEDENLSMPASLMVITNSSANISNVKLFYDIQLTDSGSCLNRYTSLFGLKGSDIQDKNIKKSYFILSSNDKNFTYFDYYDYKQINSNLVFLVESTKIYNLAGLSLNAWIVLIIDINGEEIIESTPLSVIHAPPFISSGNTGGIGLAKERYTDTCPNKMYNEYLELCIFNDDNLIKIGDIFEITANKSCLQFPITAKIFSKYFVIPLLHLGENAESVSEMYTVSYKITQGNKTILGNKIKYT